MGGRKTGNITHKKNWVTFREKGWLCAAPKSIGFSWKGRGSPHQPPNYWETYSGRKEERAGGKTFEKRRA